MIKHVKLNCNDKEKWLIFTKNQFVINNLVCLKQFVLSSIIIYRDLFINRPHIFG